MEKLGARHQNLDQKVYTTLKSMVIERKLPPGTKIVQDKIAEELGVSRTPLVNALKKLEHEKLVASIPRKGFFVRLFSKQELVQIFELREVLEGLTARRAALECSDAQLEKLSQFFEDFKNVEHIEDVKKYAHEDRDFHSFLIKVGGEGMLSDILDTYNIVTLSYQLISQEGLVRHPKETLAEHIAIIEAIRERKPLRAEKLARLHLTTSRKRLQKSIEESDAVET